MKPLKVIKYTLLGIFNAFIVYLIPITISFEAWFLLSLIILNSVLINVVYFTDRFKALKWILPGMIFMISFVVFPAVYNTFISFTNWSTGHILNKSQAIQILESRTYTPDNQKGVEFDIYVMQDQELNFYYFADLNENEMYFGKAVKQEDIQNSQYASHEPSIKKDGIIIPPEGFYLLSGKEQIANSTLLQDLSLVINKNTRAKLYKISVFGASTGRLSSTSQMYSYDEEQDVLVNNSTGRICPLEIDNFVCDGIEVDPGWRVYVGTENYERLFLNERIRSSLNIVTKWTFQFAILSVIFAFSVGQKMQKSQRV